MVERNGTPRQSSPTPLTELALLFLKLGTTAFGGPAAHIAMMEDEVVRRRRWLSSEKFLDLLGATNLIPGPNSTEMAIPIGYRQAGWPGLVVAGSCFILPAALMVTGFAWAYVRYGSLPQATRILYGIKPVIIAVVLQALWSLGRTAVKTKFLAAVGIAALVLSFLRIHELLVLFCAGLTGGVVQWIFKRNKQRKSSASAFFLLQAAAPAAAAATVPVSLWPLFLFFLKIGSVLFGSGYVLLAFLRADLVERWHWLTNAQLLDAIAVGQVTPGPVFTTATFIGYILAGSRGAIVATIGIFLPAFVFVAISGPIVPRIRRSPTAGAFLDGINIGSLALMASVTFELGRTALVDVPTIALAVISAFLLLRYKMNSVWFLLAGALAGLIFGLIPRI
jgi:chromate transporter